jgi:alpha-galactosidase
MLPCSSNADCTTDAGAERSSAFEWAAWQFNRPAEGDGMVQAFRRDKNEDSMKTLILRGLDPGKQYLVTDLETGRRSNVSGSELMQKGLHIEINEKPGAVVVVYEKTDGKH